MDSQTLSIDDIPDSAILAEPLMSDGMLLLPAGAVLTAAVISHLHKRGIQKVTVEVPASHGEGTAAATPHGVDPAAVQERLAHLFRYALRLRQLNPLFHIVTAYRQGGSP